MLNAFHARTNLKEHKNLGHAHIVISRDQASATSNVAEIFLFDFDAEFFYLRSNHFEK